MRRVLSGLIFTLMTAPFATAHTFHDVTMPETITVNKQALVLNGMGLRELSVFMIVIRVYVAGLYLPKVTADCAGVLESKGLKQVDMHFLRHVSSKELSEALEKSVKENCGANCASLTKQAETLKTLVPAPDSNDTLHVLFDDKGTDFSLNSKSLGRVDGVDFSKALLSAFIGNKPVTQDLKKGLCTPFAAAHPPLQVH